MRNIHSDSGISEQVLKTILNTIQNEKTKKIVFNLTLDEMSIRKKSRFGWTKITRFC